MKTRILVLALMVFICTKSVAQWQQTIGPYGGPVGIQCFASIGSNFFAGTTAGVFLSVDSGSIWKAVNAGITCFDVRTLAVLGTKIYAGTYGAGIFLSIDSGTNWTAVDSGLTNHLVNSIVINGSNIFAGTWRGGALPDGGVFLSSDSGSSWSQVVNGLTNHWVWSLAISGTNLFAGTNGGIFISGNNGGSWAMIDSGFSGNPYVYSILVRDSIVIIGCSGRGVYFSHNYGTSWDEMNQSLGGNHNLPDLNVRRVVLVGSKVYATTASGVYSCAIPTAPFWIMQAPGWSGFNVNSNPVLSLFTDSSNLFALETGGEIYLSPDHTVSWKAGSNSGMTSLNFTSLGTNTNTIFAGASRGVYKSYDGGITWPDSALSGTSYPHSLLVNGTNLVGSGGDISASTDNGNTWSHAAFNNYSFSSFAASETNIYAGGNHFNPCSQFPHNDGLLFLSADSGISWAAIGSGLANKYITTLAITGTNIFAGTDSGIFLSVNNCINWTSVDTGLTNLYITALLISGQNIFAGTRGGVFLSNDNGNNWTNASTGLTNTWITSLVISGTNIFAGTYGGGVFFSNNNGTSWADVSTGLTNFIVHTLAVNATDIFAASDGSALWKRAMNGITGINEVRDNPAYFTIFPNPAKNNFTITTELINARVEIFDMIGEKVYSEQLNAKDKTININFTAGIYFVRVANTVRKLVVE